MYIHERQDSVFILFQYLRDVAQMNVRSQTEWTEYTGIIQKQLPS